VLTVEYLQEIVAAFNSRDVEKIGSYFAADAAFYASRGGSLDGARIHGREAIKKYLADRFKVIRIVRGTQNGRAIEARGVDLWDFRGDKVLNKDTYWKIRS